MTAPATSSTPIAVIGLSCRFAGDATDPDNLWGLMQEKRSSWSTIPASRFNANGIYHPNGQRVGSTHVEGGHFLQQDVAAFDAAFFNMSADVASSMDPQYRMMLEVVYESLESAGVAMERAAASNTSVYAGVMFRDYHDSMSRDPDTVPRYFMTGNAATMASNRVSHFFDLRGPSMTVDTGCSTTLTALHLAVQGIRARECDMSIVTGASLMLNPDIFLTMSNLGFLSPDGSSYAFDDRANGYGRGEGVAALVLKPLENALQDGDPIRAVIRETALNQDGRTATITAPSDEAQARLIRACYQKVGLDPGATTYVEAHGTGTPVGDPLEISAVASAFGTAKRHRQPLLVGSVKSNIGHTEAASGLASVIKVILSLERGLIPPNGNLQQPNPKLRLGERNIEVPRDLQPWPILNGIRRASVNNFGFGGANAHAILESHSPLRSTGDNMNGNGYVIDEHDRSHLLIISARDKPSCLSIAAGLRDRLVRSWDTTGDDALLDSLTYTLGSRRSRFEWSMAFTAHSLADLAHRLQEPNLPQPKRAVRGNAPLRVGWVFTGQGAQWYAMGRELIPAYPVFKEAIMECDRYIQEMGSSWTIMEELHRDKASSRVNDAQFSLPLSTAIQIALVRLLWSWGAVPAAVSSHSSGEVAAAYAAGGLTCRAAIGIVYIRGALTIAKGGRAEKRQGGMLAAGLSRDDATSYIARLKAHDLVVACVNSQSSVTLSGDAGELARLEKLLKADDVFARRLNVTEAFHSEHMRPVASLFGTAMMGLLQRGEARGHPVVFASPKTGGRLQSLDVLAQPAHWVESMLQPVEFETAFRLMCFGTAPQDPLARQEVDMVLEIGPHGALGGPIQQLMTLPEFGSAEEITYLSCLSRGENAVSTMHRAAAELICKGQKLDLDAINFPNGRLPDVRVLSNLPHYPWNHQKRYWREPRNNKALNSRAQPPHDLLGSIQPNAPPSAPVWRHIIRVSDVPWVRHHMVDDNIVYPGAGFVAMAIEGFCQMQKQPTGLVTSYMLRDVEFTQALLVPDDETGVETRLTIRPCGSQTLGTKDWHEFEVHSVSAENTWASHCTGLVKSEVAIPGQDVHVSAGQGVHWQDTQAYTRDHVPEDLWAALRAVGIYHGPSFQNIHRIQRKKKESSITFSIADIRLEMPCHFQSDHIIHPTTLDSAIQAAYTVVPTESSSGRAATVPRRISHLRVSASVASSPGHLLQGHTRLLAEKKDSFEVDVNVTDESGQVVEIQGLAFQSIRSARAGPEADTEVARGCVSWSWGPDLAMLESHTLHDMMAVPPEQSEVDLIMELRRCTLHYIQEALGSINSQDIENMEWHHKKFHAWMRDKLRLAADGQLGPGSADWASEDAGARESLRTKVAQRSVNGEMLRRLGPRIPSMLRREVAPLELMMQDQLLMRYYVDALKWSRASQQASQLVRHCAHKNPRARVLEIGGGTGACTQAILDALEKDRLATGELPLASYEFTDISSGFFEAARKRFRPWQDTIRFETLDIERDPETQGFEAGAYDVIVACQVLHATANIRRTLGHVRSLLKPGGKLVLVETTNDHLDLFLVFGLLPGWWLSEEEERKATPSLSIPFWDQVLRETGLSGVDFEVHDCESEEHYMLSVMMSSAVEPPSTSPALPLPPVTIVVGDNASAPPSDWLARLQASTAERGFTDVSVAACTDMTPASGRYCIFVGEMDRPFLADAGAEPFRSLVAMAQSCKGLLWVTRGATMECEDPWRSLHLGLLRTLRNENGGRKYVSLDLDPSGRTPWSDAALSAITRVLAAALHGAAQDSDTEYAERGGVVLVPRAHQNKALNDWARSRRGPPARVDAAHMTRMPFRPIDGRRQLRMDVGTPGLLDTLFFREDAGEPDGGPARGWVEIEPRAFGLNFRDVMVAMGRLEGHGVMGFECAGVVAALDEAAARASGLRAGDRVCALLTGHWRTRPRAPWTSVVTIPAGLDFVRAASVPLVFATAHVALEETARLRRGERVLIHAGAGGVGQAAIMLAQRAGADVFATAGTAAKRRFLADKFGLRPDRVFSSRDAAFAARVMAATGGAGVDVVLNSLAGALLQASFDCLGAFGRFVDIGKRDFEQNSRLDMFAFSRNVSFASLDLLAWQTSRGADIARTMRSIADLLASGAVEPVGPIATYPLADIEKAFRVMQSGQHTGKIVVTVDAVDTVPVAVGPEGHVPAPLSLASGASYLVVGGLGGLGRCFCEWLVDLGATSIVVMSRTARSGPFLAELAEAAEAAGGAAIRIRAIACDVSDPQQLQDALRDCRDLPPIRGVIQGAMVLQDTMLENMTVADFQAAVRPKAQGSWNLHSHLGDGLDFFVMLSSLVGVMGGPGQANYASACTFQDALAAHRRSRGLPGVSLDLGMVKSVGYVARADSGKDTPAASVSDRLSRLGFQALDETQVLEVLEAAIVSSSKHTDFSCPPAVVTGINTAPGPHWAEATWLRQPCFAGLRHRDPMSSSSSSPDVHEQNGLHPMRGGLRQKLQEAPSLETATGITSQAITQKVGSMFGRSEAEVNSACSLASLGVDSLVAVELRNWITAQMAAEISTFELMQNVSLAELSRIVAQKSSLVDRSLVL